MTSVVSHVVEIGGTTHDSPDGERQASSLAAAELLATEHSSARQLAAGQEADIAKFERMLAAYLSGDLHEDVFRVFRLTNGIYGQRQGGTHQMVRIKSPYGRLTADQLDVLADIADEESRGWGHITTRQNFQFHFVELTRIPHVLRKLASVGLTTREACGDTVRTVQGCHLAGACPFEVLDITAWAEAAHRHFLRNPIAQRLPRKFKINFSGCDTDCGQAMFNDAGVVATSRRRDDGTIEAGFRVFVAGGLGANPHPALALEPFTPKEQLLPTLEAILRVFDQTGNRKNKLRARMKWVVDELGWDELRARILAVREFLPAPSSWPGGIPDVVEAWGDAPRRSFDDDGGKRDRLGPRGQRLDSWYDASGRWDQANVVRGTAKGTVSAYAWARLGDVTANQMRGLADLQRELGVELRLTNRQNVVLRGLAEDQLDGLFERLTTLGMAEPGAELSRDVVACPGADTCNLAVTQSRGLAAAIGDALDAAGLAELPGLRTNISGCTNSCGQHHIADIGFHGAERRAHGRSAPGYQLLLGGYVGEETIHFGERAGRLPAKNVPEAVVRIARLYADERRAGEDFRSWLERAGGAREVGTTLLDLDHFPSPDDDESFYVDYGEQGPYEKVLGESECAV